MVSQSADSSTTARRRTFCRRVLAFLPVVALGLVGLAQGARAASYTVYVCDLAHGNANHAMQFSSNIGTNIAFAQSCSGVGKGRGLQTWSKGGPTPGAHAGSWWFDAPAGTTITHLTYKANFSAWDGWVAHWATSGNGSGDPEPFGDCWTTGGCNVSDGGVGGGSAISTAVDDATGIGVGIWCHASSCAANDSSSTFGPAASANVYSVDLTLNEPSAPALSASGSLWGLSPGQWISGVAAAANAWNLNLSASDPAGPCELQAVILSAAGSTVLSDTSGDVAPDFTSAAPCGSPSRTVTNWRPAISSLSSGTYYLHVQANDPAGLIAPDLIERLNVDNTPPALSITSDTRQADSHWVDHAVTFQLSASKPAGLSGVQAIHYQLDSGAWQTVEGASASVTVDGTGQHAIVAYATDNAGNSSSIERSTALIDQTPPTGVFEPISPNNPRQLVADVADGDSGVAGGDIELEVEGQWQSIPTTFNGTQLIGFVNDDKLPRGYWPARAIVTDAAGNTAVVNALGDGTAMVVPIPLRLQTRVLAGTATKRVRVCSVKRVPVGDERISGSGAPPSRLTRICSTVTEPSSHGPLKLAFHQRGEATGVLSTSAGGAGGRRSDRGDRTAAGLVRQTPRHAHDQRARALQLPDPGRPEPDDHVPLPRHRDPARQHRHGHGHIGHGRHARDRRERAQGRAHDAVRRARPRWIHSGRRQDRAAAVPAAARELVAVPRPDLHRPRRPLAPAGADRDLRRRVHVSLPGAAARAGWLAVPSQRQHHPDQDRAMSGPRRGRAGSRLPRRSATATGLVLAVLVVAWLLVPAVAGATRPPTFTWPMCAPACKGGASSGPRVTAIYVSPGRVKGVETATVDVFAAGLTRSAYGQLCYWTTHASWDPGCEVIATARALRTGADSWWLRFSTRVLTKLEVTGTGSPLAYERQYWFGVLVSRSVKSVAVADAASTGRFAPFAAGAK